MIELMLKVFCVVYLAPAQRVHDKRTLHLGAAGYWQVLVESKSRKKTAFVTHSGLFEFSVMPFGLKNALAMFQRLLETVHSGLIRKTCLDYLDDIIVLGRSFPEHLVNLHNVFLHLRNANLRLKPSKCYLGMKEVEYLGTVSLKLASLLILPK